MNITGDYHTHTKYSKYNHGKNSIKEMVEYAEELGLESYGISDHGPKHYLFGIWRKNIAKARRDVDEINKTSKIKVYMGIEANLMGVDGSIDLTHEEIEMLDILIVGYHRATFNNIYNAFRARLNPEKQKEINTAAYINCLNRYKVNIISHINEYIKVDLLKVCSLAKEKGTLIELNNKHVKSLSKQDIQDIIDSGCSLILSSDAHKKKDIANFNRNLEVVEKYNIPLDRIANVDKLYR